MPLYPAAKGMDTVVGIDSHAGNGNPLHPFNGPLSMWYTPKFPVSNVLINGMPACTVAAEAKMPHIPTVFPPLEPTNLMYWNRRTIAIPLLQTLVGFSLAANAALGLLASIVPKNTTVESFTRKVTGINTSSIGSAWQSIKTSFSNFSQWQRWTSLMMNPLPFPGGQGCTVSGSTSVTVNGAPMAFSGPSNAVSCSDVIVAPNANIIGFSNVLVGVNYNDQIRQQDEKKREEKRKLTIRYHVSEKIAELSKIKLILTSNKGYRQEKAIKKEWNVKSKKLIEIVFTDLVVKGDPRENPKYTLSVDYGNGGTTQVISKAQWYGAWIAEKVSASQKK